MQEGKAGGGGDGCREQRIVTDRLGFAGSRWIDFVAFAGCLPYFHLMPMIWWFGMIVSKKVVLVNRGAGLSVAMLSYFPI